MPTVRVRGLEDPVEVEPGKDLMAALRARNVNLLWGPWAQAFHCRGIGLCSLCKVRVLDGAEQLAPRTKREQKRLRNRPEDWRLACQVRFQGPDADVALQPFPLVRPEEKAQPEAVRRALLPQEERTELEAQDIAAERQRLEQEQEARRTGKKGRRRLPFGRKGDAAEDDKAPAKGLRALGRRRGKKDGPEAAEPATAEPTKPEVEKPKRRFAIKGKS